MIRDYHTQEFKGFCFIEFESKDDAAQVVRMNGIEYAGRPLKIDFDLGKSRSDSRDRRDFDRARLYDMPVYHDRCRTH